MSSGKPSIAIVGAGKTGSALAFLLHDRGYPVSGVASRTLASAEKVAHPLKVPATDRPQEVTIKADVVFLTTPDRVIAEVAERIGRQGGFRPGQIVFHTSGAQPADEVGAARRYGAVAGSLHPLQSFADVQTALANLPHSYFALEGDAGAMPLAEEIVRDLQGISFVISTKDKPLYHAAACIASNYLVSLMHLATGLFTRFGLSRNEAFKALLPLVRGTIKNIEQLGTVSALTGPLARGDVPTIQGHLTVLEKIGGQELDLYYRLGLYTIQLALEQGSLTRGQAEELTEIFLHPAQGIGENKE